MFCSQGAAEAQYRTALHRAVQKDAGTAQHITPQPHRLTSFQIQEAPRRAAGRAAQPQRAAPPEQLQQLVPEQQGQQGARGGARHQVQRPCCAVHAVLAQRTARRVRRCRQQRLQQRNRPQRAQQGRGQAIVDGGGQPQVGQQAACRWCIGRRSEELL